MCALPYAALAPRLLATDHRAQATAPVKLGSATPSGQWWGCGLTSVRQRKHRNANALRPRNDGETACARPTGASRAAQAGALPALLDKPAVARAPTLATGHRPLATAPVKLGSATPSGHWWGCGLTSVRHRNRRHANALRPGNVGETACARPTGASRAARFGAVQPQAGTAGQASRGTRHVYRGVSRSSTLIGR